MGYKSDSHRADRTQEADDFPEVILIDNCNACNLRCSMCDHKNMRQYRKTQLMDMGLYRKLIDEIAQEKPDARVWEIFFGDPFMCRDMAGRIGYAKRKGLTDVVLNSNGVMMSKERAVPVIEAGLDAMYVGIDASTEGTYDRIRVGGDFSRAVNNVLQYRDLLSAYGSGTQKLFVQFVISDVNEDEVESFKAFWTKEGVNVKIRPKVSWAGLVEASNLLENEQVGRKPCYWLMRTINICADGQVALCSVDVHCQVKCGNANEHKIKELWQGQLKGYRAMHKEGRFGELPQMCRQCRDWQSGYAEFFL
ncbi:MAG: radical SAM/SPASM domain-containing protein [Thermodesulfobacteriota bacterium]|nr:radical SAM/SPASM domain-containing protein [Thermodesulfobacteriota bacterium]